MSLWWDSLVGGAHRLVVVSVCTTGCGVIPPLPLNSNHSQMPLVKLIASGKTQLASGLHNMCALRAWHGLNSQGNSQVVLRLSHVCVISLLFSILLPSLTLMPMLHDMVGCWCITVSPILASGKEHQGPFRVPTQSSIESPQPIQY